MKIPQLYWGIIIVKMIYDEDAMNSYKKKIWNTVAFLIISELILVVVDIIKFYYGDYIAS